MPVANRVLSALDAALDADRPLCSLRAARAFRRALLAVEQDGDGRLAQALAATASEDWTRRRDWDSALRLALRTLRSNAARELVLEAWAGGIGRQLRFDDEVAFQLLRRLPSDNRARRTWVHALVPLAIARRDVSLIETLLLVLRARAAEFPALLDVALACAPDAPSLRRALRSSCDM